MNRAELKEEQKKIVRNALWSALFCFLVLAAGYIVLPHYFQFPTGLAERMAFALQADLFVLAWVVIAVRMVSKVRFYSPEDNAGSAYTVPSPKIALPRAFLQNTLEQAVIAVGAHLALATLLSGAALALIPSAIFLFAIGRMTFLRGYPKGAPGRAFGIVMTVLPTAAGYVAAMGIILTALVNSFKA